MRRSTPSSIGSFVIFAPFALFALETALLACGTTELAASPGPSGAATNGGAASAGATTTDGLPCSVANVLASECLSCHGSPPTGGAPISLVTYANLLAPSKSDPSKTMVALSVERMRDAQRPMPPGRLPPAAEVAALQAWIDAGTPQGACASSSSGDTTTALVCTSGTTWTRGDRGSSSMHPGRACIDCHSQGEGPDDVVAGTVFPTAHEPDDCYGVGGTQVIVTDSQGASLTLTANSAGNFAGRGLLTPPLSVKLQGGGKSRLMNGTVSTGDCNACHTASGAQGAPGRIMAP